jgi:hypothetical protein
LLTQLFLDVFSKSVLFLMHGSGYTLLYIEFFKDYFLMFS